jgi:hypothetical protein
MPVEVEDNLAALRILAVVYPPLAFSLARQWNQVQFQCSDAERLAFVDAFFDAVRIRKTPNLTVRVRSAQPRWRVPSVPPSLKKPSDNLQ